jgi:tetratricopeptide (TPR) repeat protein
MFKPMVIIAALAAFCAGSDVVAAPSKQALLNKAQKLLKEYRADEALPLYDKVISVDPKSVDAFYGRGIAYGEMGQYQKAVADYTKALQLSPKRGYIYYNRGFNLYAMGYFDRAVADFTKAIEINPKDVGALGMRAIVYDRLGKTDLAKKDKAQSEALEKH